MPKCDLSNNGKNSVGGTGTAFILDPVQQANDVAPPDADEGPVSEFQVQDVFDVPSDLASGAQTASPSTLRWR